MPSIPLQSKLPRVTEPSLKNLTKLNYGKPEEAQHPPIQDLTRPHVDSFNWFVNDGVKLLAKGLAPLEVLINNDRLALSFTDISVEKPKIEDGFRNCRTTQVYPSECRQRGATYQAKIQASLSFEINGMKQGTIPRCLGTIPIMVKSDRCNLHGLSPKELVEKQEEEQEMGGYFVVNGNEKVVRMLIMQRRNYPVGIVRPSWKNRGQNYTEFGVSVRSMTEDQTTAPFVLHYLSNGTVTICVYHRKEMFFLPLVLILKALVPFSDRDIYKELIKTKEDDTYFTCCVQNMLRQAQAYNLFEQKDFLRYLGEKFRIKLNRASWYSDTDIAHFMLKHHVLIHLDSNEDKFRLISFMTRKVFDLALGKCMPDDADSVQNQEVLLPGHLFQMVIKEKLNLWLLTLSRVVLRKATAAKAKTAIPGLSSVLIQNSMSSVPDVTSAMSYLLATGTLVSNTGLGLMQFAGLTVIADKLNYMRYISHFRCIHRGAFFAQMRTTTVRKLLPESWGFLCPVHTPDGSPCGLMNHMSFLCEIVTHPPSNDAMLPLLNRLGMLSPTTSEVAGFGKFYPVILDGKLIGWMPVHQGHQAVNVIRCKKARGQDNVPITLEICLIEYTGKPTQYPGLYLMSQEARMVRPVMNLITGTVEMIGSFEQVYMNICIIPEEAHKMTTHQELSQHSILSAVASLTPYSDFNQSPRNMYQCQMGKQTMGTPCQAIAYRADNKLYRIQTPQAALVRPYMYDHYKMDNFPFGQNAVVAVISYTGYDMEDAMILNKGSFDRGFAYGTIYKTDLIDLSSKVGDRTVNVTFGTNPKDDRFPDLNLGADGLPAVGQRLLTGDNYYSYIDHSNSEMKVVKYSGQETGYVDSVRVLSNNAGTGHFKRVSIVLRVQRNPIIGDKFASRHGQKGICSQKWPMANLPFTESGMFPDIVFNPHGFPSRMTIGMMIESMAGKSAAMHGHCYDATPFTFTEDKPAIEFFGDLLTEAGYNYYGTETMYSGVSGLEMEAQIFIGIVYYQRLRHMVSDKFQVRTTGPVDMITQQPVKGRKRAGGIRFGEMERDALLAHGCAMLLYDRLLTSSDCSKARLCEKCGSLLTTMIEKEQDGTHVHLSEQKWICRACHTGDHIVLVDIPFVYRYLVNELAAMNIKTILSVE
nr:DNA-directed RNA polymerase I subunit RPA2-like [Ciona intestinalis]XP_018667297.1 DNA-directed RNA polymerase I subunit RPA2-like [Ciona intestinalis]|eukprot:XP_002131003.1 DNA-directed RNA polymerase I subunit RPA2-like [Ciona intestinalis]